MLWSLAFRSPRLLLNIRGQFPEPIRLTPEKFILLVSLLGANCSTFSCCLVQILLAGLFLYQTVHAGPDSNSRSLSLQARLWIDSLFPCVRHFPLRGAFALNNIQATLASSQPYLCPLIDFSCPGQVCVWWLTVFVYH